MIKYKALGEQKKTLAFLGCGNIVKSHVKSIRWADKQIDLAFASRNAAKAEKYNKEYSGAAAFSNYEDAVASDAVDIIFITTPPHLHYDLAKQALTAGKHVIVEKPPFFKSSDILELGQLADAQGLQLLISENYFYKPMRYRIKELIESGVVGKPLFINLAATKKQKSKEDWREEQELAGAGALFEGGIHWVNFMNNIGLTINDVHGYRPIKEGALERSIQVTAGTQEGAIINLQYSWEVDTMFFGLRLSKILGTEGSITFESNGILLMVRGRRKKIAFPKLTHITGFKPMFRDFFVSLRAGKQPEFSHQMARRDLEIIEEAYGTLDNHA